MQIQLNGTLHQISPRATVSDLVNNLNFRHVGYAIAINQKILQRSEYLTTMLHENDRVDIIVARKVVKRKHAGAEVVYC